MDSYNVIGLMSGTSLDGVDLALCRFEVDKGQWKFKLMASETVPYSTAWKQKLAMLHTANALELAQADADYGHYLGGLVKQFISTHTIKTDFVSSHGHTIFHQPEKGLTLQIGNGAALAAEAGLPVVCDFRTLDVALGGQGAPLVPIGDRLLFTDYTYCLNLGGIANISFEKDGSRIAFDICPVNMVLNALAKPKGLDYDADGNIAKAGIINAPLLEALNNLDFYAIPSPKSLGREWVEQYIFPILGKSSLSIEDKLSTFCEHIAMQVAATVKDSGSLLATGGGAFNTFLIARIQKHTSVNVTLPPAEIINYKEALIFALLGVLRMRGENNCLKSVTGASKDNCGGSIYKV